MTAASARLRTIVVALVVGVAMASPTRADPKPDPGPPPLTSSSSQFVELRPVVEAPSLKLERSDGRVVDLMSLKGKVVLMSFWATWCPPCRRELPMLQRLQQSPPDKDLEIVPVSVDQAGKVEVASFLKRIGALRLAVFLDPQGRIGARTTDGDSPFVLYGMPITYVIDRRGHPVGYITGEVDWESKDALALLRYFAREE